jgi:hypothetical protein
LEYQLVLQRGSTGIDVDVKVLGVEEIDADPGLLRGRDYGLLFPTDGVVEERERGRRLLAPVFSFNLRRAKGE